MSTRANQMAELIAQGLTLAQVGEKFGVSRERVRQIVGSPFNYRGTRAEQAAAAIEAKKGIIDALRAERKSLDEIGALTGISANYLKGGEFAAKPPAPLLHGTQRGYNRGCRCSECTAASTQRMRDYVTRKKADGFAGLDHGSYSTYGIGCRCKLCREANREAQTKIRRARGQVPHAEASKLRWETRRAKYGPSGKRRKA
jgi:DNA-binding CsgD family transcriptional regulator